MDFGKPNVEVGKGKEKINNRPNELSVAEIDKWMKESIELDDNLCCLLYGADGSAKSGVALSYLTDEDIKNGMSCVVIDLDDGNRPLIKMYHKKRCEKYNKNWQDVFRVMNPQANKMVEDDIVPDYKRTIARIRGIINWTRAKQKEYNIKFIVFDGLSKALKYAEYFMRMEKNVDADGGIQTRFWLIRK